MVKQRADTIPIRVSLQPKQSKLLDLVKYSSYTRIGYGGSNGGGKALSLETIIPTPDGYTTMGRINAGDYVYGDDGLPVKVIWTSGIMTDSEAYSIEFSTGEVVKADAKHLWKTLTNGERAQQKRLNKAFRDARKSRRASRAKTNPIKISSQLNITELNKNRSYSYKPPTDGYIRNTKDILATIGKTHAVCNTQPIDNDKKDLIIEPYLLGIWLGDGISAAGAVAMMQNDLIEIKSYIMRPVKSEHLDTGRKTPFLRYLFEGLQTDLRRLGLSNNKHIPLIYLRASYSQRLNLLRGLMDTDGTVDKRGHCSITFSKKKLIEQTHELISSFGIKSQIKEKIDGKGFVSYKIQFMPDFICFNLQRKAKRQILFTGQSKQRYIKKITRIESEPMRCIQVDNSDGMYLITKSYIPTHNSDGIRSVNLILCTEPKPAPIKTLIFRRRSNDLLENHINPFFQRYPQLKKLFNKTERIIYWTDGSTTKFGSADNEDDVEDFEGKEYDYEFIDEATHCTQKMIEFLQTRNRSTSTKAKMIFTMIPGFVGHNFIKRLFITKQYTAYEDPSAYVYLPAKVWDNVVWVEDQLTADNISVATYYDVWDETKRREYTLKHSDYAKVLSHLPEQKMEARLFGDWYIFEGQFFDEWNPEIHVIKSEDYLPYDKINSSGFTMLAGMDYGNDTFVYYGYRDYNDNIVIFDEFWDVKSTRQVKIANQVKFQAERGLINIPIEADTNMFIKDAFDVETSNSPAEEYIEAGLNLYRVSKASTDQRGYRIQCWDTLKNMLHWKMDDGKLTVPPKIKIYARCHKLIDSLPALIADEKNIEDIADGQYDHPVDALKMLVMSLRLPVRPKENLIPEYLQIKLNKHKYKNLSVMSE